MPIRAVVRAETLELDFYLESGDHVYSIDLGRCRTSAALLDGICQLAAKTWLTHEDLGLVVRAIDELLEPQGLLCGNEIEKGPVDVERLRKRVASHDGVDIVARFLQFEAEHRKH